ncbi:MAG: hypothetical protein CMJ64_04350 [Planctomycetaceae bacterium]|nr:hypothetical protein [Planctomycetaceae bacterium]
MLDNVGVMNYRDTADGADGMIAHGRELLEYADNGDAAIIYMGIETFRYRPTPIWFAAGLPRAEFKQQLRSAAQHITHASRLNEFRLQTFEAAGCVSLGIELPAEMTSVKEQLARRTMLELAQHFGTSCQVDELSDFFQEIRQKIDKDAEWDNLRSRSVADYGSKQVFGGFVLDSIMLSKITFADDSFQNLKAQVRAAEEYFSRYTRYGGTAIHYYETFRDKVSE